LPREPTIAVSAKLTRVVKICSINTGHAKRMIVIGTLLDSSVTLSGFLGAIRNSSSKCVLPVSAEPGVRVLLFSDKIHIYHITYNFPLQHIDKKLSRIEKIFLPSP
jgi:hypothetical protein